jgi:hypothetical protein
MAMEVRKRFVFVYFEMSNEISRLRDSSVTREMIYCHSNLSKI